MDYLMVLVISIAAFVWLYHKRSVQPQKDFARYKLYRARDEFVALAAEGVLNTNDPVFKHFYKNINNVLQIVPEVGLDRVLEIILNNKGNKEFDKAMKQSELRLEELMNCESMKIEAVQNAVLMYYTGVKSVILAYSSIVRMIYIFTKHLTNKFLLKVIAMFPPSGELFNESYTHASTIIRKCDQRKNMFEPIAH